MILVRARVPVNVQFLFEVRCHIIELSKVQLTMSKPIVTVKQGKLQGEVVKSVLGASYIAFKAVPFAAPPIGNLRFKDPQPPEPWTDIKDSSQAKEYICMQLQEYPPYNIIGDEDCLYLNVYTNSLNQSKPVMFWIHGGAFVMGSASSKMIKPDYLLAKDVVVITTNYRLGAFGFLNLGHRVAPGNQALKDLIAALEWVKENIANFGGDPNNVTIFGASAGGVLVNSLLISPRAKGLFHKAIIQSGVLKCSWGVNQCRPDRGFKLASLLGKDSTDPVEVVEFLRSLPAKDIVKAQSSILSKEETMSYQLAFGVNSDEMAENPALPESIEQLTKKAVDVPTISCYASHEFIMFFKDKSKTALQILDKFMPAHVKNLKSLKSTEEREIEKLLTVVKNWYFDGKSVCEETIPGLVDFITDVYFAIPTKLFVEDRVKRVSSPSYLCRFSYVGNEKTPTDILATRVVSGASHVDETAYLFYLGFCKIDNPKPPAVGTKDRITLERMTKMWSNFARTGDPTSHQDEFVNVSWKPVTTNEFCYLEIGDELQLLPVAPHVLSSE